MEAELTWRTLTAMYSLYEGNKISATKKVITSSGT